jgi:hypothetical protein
VGVGDASAQEKLGSQKKSQTLAMTIGCKSMAYQSQ